jgi:hypothetical protein
MRQADPSLPIVNYLYEIGIGYIRFAVENPDHFLLMFTAVPPGPVGDFSPEKLLEGDSSFHILLGAIRRGIEEGVFIARLGFGLMEMTYTAWVTVHGISMLRVTSLRGYPRDPPSRTSTPGNSSTRPLTTIATLASGTRRTWCEPASSNRSIRGLDQSGVVNLAGAEA